MSIKIRFIIEGTFEADDYIAVANHQKLIEEFTDQIKESFPDAEFNLRERRDSSRKVSGRSVRKPKDMSMPSKVDVVR